MRLGPVPIALITKRLIQALWGAWTMAELFWLSDAQWALIEPLLPDLGGKPRVDDRRVISGILHRFREGLRWRAVPGDYGPRTTLYNRFNRWSKRGLWQQLFATLAITDDPPSVAMVDSTVVRAHRAASGAKGGSKARPSAARVAGAPRKSTRLPMARDASTPSC
jgi:transposase